MSRVFSEFPDRDEGGPEQGEFALPASRREPAAGGSPLPGERAGFFREQRRPVLPLIGLVAAVATVTFFLWLGGGDGGSPPPEGGEALAPVATAPGTEPALPDAPAFDPSAPPAAETLAAAGPPEPAPMPAVPSVLDAPGVAPPTEDVPAEAAPAKRSVAETAPARDAFAVQLLAARSEADVGASWERLRGSYPDLLASLTPSVTRTSRAEGTFFRLRAGPLRNRASADALCRALSQREQSCFVVSPGS